MIGYVALWMSHVFVGGLTWSLYLVYRLIRTGGITAPRRRSLIAAISACVAVNTAITIIDILLDVVPLAMIAATNAAVEAWIAWDLWRHTRRRRPSRVAGVVRRVRGRLVVVPAPQDTP